MFNQPREIFVDLKMSLYLADCGNDRMQRFRVGERNETSRRIDLDCPVGIMMDGDLFIAD